MTGILIAVASYRRPGLLRDLLRSLEADDLPEGTRVCVVDNDPSKSAEPVVVDSSLPISYVHEPRPGIAAARNRGLEEIRGDDEFVVFVDDDERVEPGWLNALRRVQREYDADVVSGPVISVFPDDVPEWIVRGKFIQRARFATGSKLLSPATNNTLLRLTFWRSLGSPVFDEEFSLTGGSDTAFFRRIRDAGAVMIWSDDAIVHEDVPTSRATFSWIWRRGVREGNVTGRLHLRSKSRGHLAFDGFVRVALGTGMQVKCWILGRGLDSKSIAYVTRGIGWIGASTNRLVVEYARQDTSRQ